MPLTGAQLQSLADHGLQTLALLDGLAKQVRQLIGLRQENELNEAQFILGLAEAVMGIEHVALPHRHEFELVALRYALKRKSNESAARRMRKIRALRSGEEPEAEPSVPVPEPHIPSEHELAREAELVRMAQASEDEISIEEALWGEGPKAPEKPI